MSEIVRREDVEQLLGCCITDGEFNEALDLAKKKQEYIYNLKQSPVVLELWYLAKLTEEYVRSLAFSKFTMDLCGTVHDMEKEHLFNELGAPTDTHILADSAL